MSLFDALFGKNKPDSDKKILVVEDNEIDRKVVVKTLERAGYAVDVAKNGQEGYRKATTTPPELIILDCEMPEMGGIEMCQKLKEIDQLRDIPVVFLTSLDTPGNVLDCFEADAENFLAKPLKPKVLIKEIEKIFADRTAVN